MTVQKRAFFWLRRDLRLDDNHGLYRALEDFDDVIIIFIFDESILRNLTDKYDRRVDFIHRSLHQIDQQIKDAGGSGLLVVHGNNEDTWPQLIDRYQPQAIYCNRDYEPDAVSRDLAIDDLANRLGVQFRSFKDQVIFEETEVMKADGDPYNMYSPYSRKWKSLFDISMTTAFPSEKLLYKSTKLSLPDLPSLEDIGFKKTDLKVPSTILDTKNIGHYESLRDLPAKDATSHLSMHLRFGTVGIRGLVKQALAINETFLNELIWRDFFMMILCHYPESTTTEFREKYRQLRWRHDKEDFFRWCKGKTGFPIVDAGMRELNKTGFMHNRVRMICASFLVKDLLIDWRWGERYFAKKLLDYDLAANVGNWQWAAGTGCDAAPYFRIFNPESQAKKFDPQQEYIRRWLPEFGTADYPLPMVDHKEAREQALKFYKRIQ